MELKTYTRQELLKKLNLSKDTKLGDIKRKLDRLKIKYEIEGRGAAAQFHIKSTITLKDFAEKYLGIVARFDDRLAHYLHLLTLEKEYTHIQLEASNIKASSLEWITLAGDDKIQEWKTSLLNCGLLKKEEGIPVYYATYREKISDEKSENIDDYLYTRKIKRITEEDFKKAAKAYNNTWNKYTEDIKTNWEKIEAEGQYLATQAKRDALDKWEAHHIKYTITLNKNWEHYQELIYILQDYKFEEYRKWEHGNYAEDIEKQEKQREKWEQEKEEKRRKLHHGLKCPDDMPAFDNIYEKLVYLKNRYGITKKGELNCYGENGIQ